MKPRYLVGGASFLVTASVVFAFMSSSAASGTRANDAVAGLSCESEFIRSISNLHKADGVGAATPEDAIWTAIDGYDLRETIVDLIPQPAAGTDARTFLLLASDGRAIAKASVVRLPSGGWVNSSMVDC